jgi:hypothetical protein
MSMIIDGTNGLTFPNSTTQASAGNVLQVVQGTYAIEVTNSTTTYADTGLTATITPKFSTSKILVIVEQSDVYAPTTTGVKLQLLRSGSSIIVFGGYVVYNTVGSIDVGTCSTTYLDSPATTSAIIYKTQFANRVNSGNASGVQNGGAATSTITLMEIAA